MEDSINFFLLKKYIQYARAKINPRMTVNASHKLEELYVADRQKSFENKKLSAGMCTIPITVRQLEAIIRLSEALARIKLKNDVTVLEVEQAH